MGYTLGDCLGCSILNSKLEGYAGRGKTLSSVGDGLLSLREIRILVLYQGTTLVGPQRKEKDLGFRP
jgi:hypothetical protein